MKAETKMRRAFNRLYHEQGIPLRDAARAYADEHRGILWIICNNINPSRKTIGKMLAAAKKNKEAADAFDKAARQFAGDYPDEDA